MSRPARILVITLFCLSLAATLYSSWALYRISSMVLFETDGVARDFPYPDRLIIWLNDWYDARYPVAPGEIKIEGELPRVHLTLEAATGGFAVMAGMWCVILLRDRQRDTPQPSS